MLSVMVSRTSRSSGPARSVKKTTGATVASKNGTARPGVAAAPRQRSREFSDGAFPPDRYLLVEVRLGEPLAPWLMARRTAKSTVAFAQLAHELMNRTNLHVTNEAVRRWTAHLKANPRAVKSYTDFGSAPTAGAA